MHLVLFLFGAAGAAQGPCADLASIDGIVQDAMTTLRIDGIAARVDQNGVVLHQRGYGTMQPATVVAIASASKWLSAAVLMAMVDQGRCRLDDRVATYVPSFNRPDKQAMTLRHCFTHASGMPTGHPAITDNTITLAQAVDRLATVPMVAAPGAEFSYGGVSMHVAGRVCEVVSGRAWNQLFADVLTTPLGMTATDFFAFGFTQNPRIAGGVRSSLLDFARFVDMLRQRGRFGAQRVLSEAAVDEMFRDQTSGLPVRNTPHPDGAPYGIGTWLDVRDAQGRTLVGSGAGAFGFAAWVDRERGASGTFSVLDLNQRTYPYYDAIRQLSYAMLKPRGIACVGAPSPACAPATYLNGNHVPSSGNASFALIAVSAPPLTVGTLALAADTRSNGLPLLGIVVHLPLLPPPVLLPWVSDALGNASMPLPLGGLSAGQQAAAQAFWFTPGGCAGDLRASHAVGLTVQLP
jgi:CubicO group peptidase (beta-lactamase class C family)